MSQTRRGLRSADLNGGRVCATHESLHRSTTISLQSATFGAVDSSPLNLHLIDHKSKGNSR